MSTVSNSALESDVNETSSTIGWDDIPEELFLYIFKKLDIESIRCCFSVSRKWKEIAILLCEWQGLWQKLAEDGIVNHGVTQRFKSTLSWKELYLNSLLWNNFQFASLNKIHEMEKVDVKIMHVYRDKLILVANDCVEYYDIETFRSIKVFSIPLCEDLQETDDLLMLVTKNNYYYEVTVFNKLEMDEQVDISGYLNPFLNLKDDRIQDRHTFADSWRWKIAGNSGYVVDIQSVLWECSSRHKSLTVKWLAKFYGDFLIATHSHYLNSIHVIKEDVYVVVILGETVLLSEKNMLFRKLNLQKLPTKFITGRNFNKRPPYKEGGDKFDAIIKVPFFVNKTLWEGMVAPRNMLRYRYDDPEMTCGLQHGDAVFRGFEDGRVEITLLRNETKLNELNVKELDSDVITDPAVIGLEVCELKNMHKLFIATAAKVYTLLMTYPGGELQA